MPSFCGRLLQAAFAVATMVAFSSPTRANPLPMEPFIMGGRIVPAAAVPVDMVSENLRVSFVRPRRLPKGAPTPFEAEVTATYVLRADAKCRVPVIFPVYGAASTLRFRVNGNGIAARTVPDLAVYDAYEATWRATVDAAVRAEPAMRRWLAEARPKVPERPASPDDARARLGVADEFWPVNARARQWWDARGAAHADRLAWSLANYLLNDWPDYSLTGDDYPSAPKVSAREKQLAREQSRRVRLWAERDLAVALDPRSPDPVALWANPEALPAQEPLSLALGTLDLRPGENEYVVTYRQPAGFSNRTCADAERAPLGSTQVPRFDYILRTARFWRSFGTLNVEVRLPDDSRWAECTLKGAAAHLNGPNPRITYAGTGVPSGNLRVLFFPCATTPLEHADALGGVPTVTLKARWDTVVTSPGCAHAAPAVDAETVVAASGAEAVICDRRTGREQRRLELPGEAQSVLLLRDRVLFVLDRSCTGAGRAGYRHPGAACYDRRSGRELWSTTVLGSEPGSGHGTRLVAAGGMAVGWSGQLGFALSLADGRIRWQIPLACRVLALSPEALAGHRAGLVFLAGQAQDARSTDPGIVRAVRLGTGEKVWEQQVPAVPLGLVSDGSRLLVALTGTGSGVPLLSLRPSNGRIIGRSEIAGQRYLSRVCAMFIRGGRLILATDMDVSAYRLQGLAREWRCEYGGQAQGDPAVSDGVVYASAAGRPMAIALSSGKAVWRCDDTSLSGPLAAEGREIFMLQSLGGLLAARELPSASAGSSPSPAAATPLAGTPPVDLPDVIRNGRRGGAPDNADAGPSHTAAAADQRLDHPLTNAAADPGRSRPPFRSRLGAAVGVLGIVALYVLVWRSRTSLG